jgi:hypothetical protein
MTGEQHTLNNERPFVRHSRLLVAFKGRAIALDWSFGSSRNTMADHDMHDVEFWYRGEVTRRRLVGYGAASGGRPGEPEVLSLRFGSFKVQRRRTSRRSSASRVFGFFASMSITVGRSNPSCTCTRRSIREDHGDVAPPISRLQTHLLRLC